MLFLAGSCSGDDSLATFFVACVRDRLSSQVFVCMRVCVCKRFPACLPCTHAHRSSSSFSTTIWYSLFLFMWSQWRFQESRAGRGFGRGVTVSRPLLWSERETFAEKKTSHGWMGCSLTKFSPWQPLLNKHGTVWWRPKGTHSLIFIHSPSPLTSYSLFVIFELRSIYQINVSRTYFLKIPLLSPCFFFSHFVAFFHQCTYQFLSPAGFNGFLCAISSQSDPSSDEYSFQRPFTGNEPISGFSSRSLLAGNLSCKKHVPVCLSIWWCFSVQASSVLQLHRNGSL